MVVTTIYISRHGFRGNWTVDPQTGTYHTHVPSPTKIPSDPPLAAYGVLQSEQLATALSTLPPPPITHIYSSPFYRCLQTLKPFAEQSGLPVRGDNGLGEWYGKARFTHPSPAGPEVLRGLFSWYEVVGEPSIIPSSSGETIEELHERCAEALACIVLRADTEDVENVAWEAGGSEKETAMLICTHAASMIAMGRVLTGWMPDDNCEDDFKTFTCGISKFVRRKIPVAVAEKRVDRWEIEMPIGKIDWQKGRGVAGGWQCVMNGDCRHLDGGEERGWHFQGDELFDETEPNDQINEKIHAPSGGKTGPASKL